MQSLPEFRPSAIRHRLSADSFEQTSRVRTGVLPTGALWAPLMRLRQHRLEYPREYKLGAKAGQQGQLAHD